MGVIIYHVDAFAGVPFQGNPAGVCILPKPRDAEWMQAVAWEMNLSETAFLAAEDDGYALRWFTPTSEVNICGHATLASAHILWETGELERDATARFQTRSGLLTAKKRGEQINMDLPSSPEEAVPLPRHLVDALDVTPRYVGRNRYDYLIELESEQAVRRIQPDMRLLRTIPADGFIVTSRSESEEFDFVTRYFAPGLGIDEDPVTGAAHCCLGPYWSRRLEKNDFVAYQASPRGGIVHVHVEGDRVVLGGRAITVFRTEMVAGD